MKKFGKYNLIFFLLISLSELITGQITPVPSGRRLREIVADKYSKGNLIIGATTGEWAFGTGTGEIMDREFNYVTPENDFKQSLIHPDNTNNWKWTKPDNWKSHVIANNQILRMHGPISPQCSNWAKNDDRTATELETNMRSFMQALCERYNGQTNFKYLDVVNETVLSGNWHKNKAGEAWEVPWFIIGQDTDKNKTPLYIKYAFEIATQYAPNLKLLFNQHERSIINSSWDLIKETILYLRNLGLRVDAIGWQAHLDVGWEKIDGQQQALKDLIDWAHQNNLEFHITEQSVYINSNSEQDFKNQAATYKAIIDILIDKSKNGIVGWNTWHIDDGHGHATEKFPSLFDNNYKAKPAYYAVQLALESKADYTSIFDVSFIVKNKKSGEPVENCKLVFDNQEGFTDRDGLVIFKKTAGHYLVKAEKNNYKPAEYENIGIWSDSTISIFMEPVEVFYNMNFELEDKNTGEKLSSVKIQAANETKNTDQQGKSDFTVNPGVVQVSFEKTNYAGLLFDFTIISDTTFTIKMERTHADVKFKVLNNQQPVNNAKIVFAGDSLFSNALGICTFKGIEVGTNESYTIEKEFFLKFGGEITVKSDTTVNIQLSKSVANIGFHVSGSQEIIRNAFVVLNNDTSYLTSEGSTTIYNVPLNGNYNYKIHSENYPDYMNSLFLENDTVLIIKLSMTQTENKIKKFSFKVYPNPAKTYLKVETLSNTGLIEIVTLDGKVLRSIQNNKFHSVLKIAELPTGMYVVRHKTNGEIYSKTFVKSKN